MILIFGFGRSVSAAEGAGTGAEDVDESEAGCSAGLSSEGDRCEAAVFPNLARRLLRIYFTSVDYLQPQCQAHLVRV